MRIIVVVVVWHSPLLPFSPTTGSAPRTKSYSRILGISYSSLSVTGASAIRYYESL